MNIEVSVVWSLNLIEDYGLEEHMNKIPSRSAYCYNHDIIILLVASQRWEIYNYPTKPHNYYYL